MRLGIRDSFCFFPRINKFYAELRRELLTGFAFSRYEQFETSPEAIYSLLTSTDRLEENYSIDKPQIDTHVEPSKEHPRKLRTSLRPVVGESP